YAPYAIAVDSAGNVYTTGRIWGSVDFDPAPNKGSSGQLVLTGTPYSGAGIPFVAKFNSSGSLAWAKTLAYGVSSMAVDAAGAVYLTGSFTGTVDFDPNAGVANRTSAGGSDIFVEKLDTNGAFQWVITTGTSGDDGGGVIAVDVYGDIYVAGSL